MNNLHQEIADQLTESLQKGVSDKAWKNIQKQVDNIKYDIETWLEYQAREDLASNLTSFVEDMAEKTIEAILDGNEDQMRRYLGCESGAWTGRSDSPEFGRKRTADEWHHVIHGKLFETGAVALRHGIVDAHKDLIANERIKDLEDQVMSLVAQVNKLTRELEKRRDSYQ